MRLWVGQPAIEMPLIDRGLHESYYAGCRDFLINTESHERQLRSMFRYQFPQP